MTDPMSHTDFSNTRVLVVGGAGFVGSNLVDQILEQNPREIIIVDSSCCRPTRPTSPPMRGYASFSAR